MIGISALGLLYSHGRRAGISGMLAGALYPRAERNEWVGRISFLVGLVVSGGFIQAFFPTLISIPLQNTLLLGVAGFLVGAGARLGGGCTSGHGICGVGSGSVRSIVATLTFIIAGVLTVWVTKHI